MLLLVSKRALLLALGCASGTGCSPAPDEPGSLAVPGLAPRACFPRAWSTVDRGDGEAPPLALAPSPDGEGLWVETLLRPEDWSAAGPRGLFRARLAVAGWGRPSSGGPPATLEGPAGTFRWVNPAAVLGALLDEKAHPPARSFSAVGRTLYATLGPESPAPGVYRTTRFLQLREQRRGVFRTGFGNLRGRGFAIPSGGRIEWDLELPEGCELRLRTAALDRVLEPGERRLRFGVEWNGRLLWLADQQTSHSPRLTFRRTRFPTDSHARGTLALEVDGPPGLGFFFTPEIVRARGPSDRPDLVVFLADRLPPPSPAGSPPAETPRFAALCRAAAVWPEAWTPAELPLASATSLLTGLYPDPRTLADRSAHLPSAPATLPELLEASGYATRALVEGLGFGPRAGLDAAFALYDGPPAPSRSPAERLATLVPPTDGPLLLFYQAAGRPEQTDATLAQVLAWLEAHRPGRERWIVVTAQRGLDDPTPGRVPLVIHGPDLPARFDTSNASWVDIAPTLLGRAGLTPPPHWPGRDLLRPQGPPHPVLSLGLDEACAGAVRVSVLLDEYEGRFRLPGGVFDPASFEASLSLRDRRRDPEGLNDLASPRGVVWTLFQEARPWIEACLQTPRRPLPSAAQ